MVDLMTRWTRGKVLRVVQVPPPVTPDPDVLLESWMRDLRAHHQLLSVADRASLTLRDRLYWVSAPPGLYVPASSTICDSAS